MTVDLLSIDEVARALNLPPTWVQREALDGHIPCLSMNGFLRFNLPAVAEVLAQRAATSRDHDDLITAPTVAKLFGVCLRTVWAWVATAGLPHYRIGRVVRFRPSELRAWAERHKSIFRQAAKATAAPIRVAARPASGAPRLGHPHRPEAGCAAQPEGGTKCLR